MTHQAHFSRQLSKQLTMLVNLEGVGTRVLEGRNFLGQTLPYQYALAPVPVITLKPCSDAKWPRQDEVMMSPQAAAVLPKPSKDQRMCLDSKLQHRLLTGDTLRLKASSNKSTPAVMDELNEAMTNEAISSAYLELAGMKKLLRKVGPYSVHVEPLNEAYPAPICLNLDAVVFTF